MLFRHNNKQGIITAAQQTAIFSSWAKAYGYTFTSLNQVCGRSIIADPC